MSNLVQNPNLTISTDGQIPVMDSLGNYPVYYPGGGGVAPDNWWYLGGPDYPWGNPGTFVDAGGVWSDRSPIVGAKSIMLDASDTKVRQSLGVTQVIPINQTARKPFRVSTHVAGENLEGEPKVLFDVIGFKSTEASGSSIRFGTGTFDFKQKKKIATFDFPIKYAFLHLYVSGYSYGKAWYALPSIEEIDIEITDIDPNNRIINPNLLYTEDEETTIGWEGVNISRYEDVTPVGAFLINIENKGYIQQDGILLDNILGTQKISVYLKSSSTSQAKVIIHGMDRFRRKIIEEIKILNLTDSWEKTEIKIICTSSIEKASIKIEHCSGDIIQFGGAEFKKDESEASQSITLGSSKQKILEIPDPQYDDTRIYKLDEPTAINQLVLSDNFPGIIKICNGNIGEFIPVSCDKNTFSLIYKTNLEKLAPKQYALPQGVIKEIFVDDDKIDDYLHIPHVTHPDYWLITEGGTIPANDKRYYAVTAVNEFGETGESNNIRAITSADSSTNKIPIEISPVENAIKYLIYMTKDEYEDPNWLYTATQIKLLDWDTSPNHFLKEVTAEELRNSGYIIYDDGTINLTEGRPPINKINTAKRWIIDEVNNKILTDVDYNNVQIYAGVQDIANITAIKYIPHSNTYYVVTNNGLYVSDVYFKTKLYRNNNISDVKLIDSYEGEIYFSKTDQSISKLDGSIIIEKPITPVGKTMVGFCVINTTRAIRFYSDGGFNVYDYAGTLISNCNIVAGNYNGLERYFDKYITFDINNKRFLVFNNVGTILQQISAPCSGMEVNSVWSVSGNKLSVLTDYALMTFVIMAEEYYAELDNKNYYDYATVYPTLSRPLLPGETIEPTYPEILPNGTFISGENIPAGFNIYGDKESVNWGVSDDVAIEGTKSLYFHFTKSSWASINSEWIEVTGLVTYVFSAYVKATVSCNGMLGISFRDEERQRIGDEQFFVFNNTTSYKLHETIITAPINAKEMEFRYLNYGSNISSVLCYINNISIKEKKFKTEDPRELIFNGDFSIVQEKNIIPSGWSTTGAGGSEMSFAIEDPIMQNKGNALKIMNPAYDLQTDNWHAIKSDKFDVVPGEDIIVEFSYRRNVEEESSFLTTMYYYTENGNLDNFEYGNIYVTSSDTKNGKRIRITHSAPTNIHTHCLLIIGMVTTSKTETQWFENITAKQEVNINLIKNPDFFSDFANWYVYDSVTIDKTTIPKSIKMVVDNIEIGYCDIRQTVVFDQSKIKIINFKAIGKSNASADNVSYVEMHVFYKDGTDVWNPHGWHGWKGNELEWTELEFNFTPSKLVYKIDFILGFGWNNGTGILNICDVSVKEIEPQVVADEIELILPFTEGIQGIPEYIKLQARLKNLGTIIEQKGINIDISANIESELFVSVTNNYGLANAYYKVPNIVGVITFTATYGNLIDTKQITFLPRIQKNMLNPKYIMFPEQNDKLYLEITAPRTKKPLPAVGNYIGCWEVFRPTVFNAEQMQDYHVHYSPESSFNHVSPDIISKKYPKVLMFEYFDYLSDYPYQVSWQEIMAKRKEWFCIDLTGYSNPFGDGRYYYNWRDKECVQWYVDRILNKMREWQDGIYLDDFWYEYFDVVSEFEWAAESSDLLNYKSLEERIVCQINSLNFLRNELHKRGKYLTCNYGPSHRFDMNTGQLYEKDVLLASPFDGYLKEVWLYADQNNPEDITNEFWNLQYIYDQINWLKYTGEQGKWVVVLARCQFEKYKARLFGLAAYLMGKHDYSYYYFSLWGPPWWSYGSDAHSSILPEQKIKTGVALEEFQLDNGLFSRKFENCVAIINFSGSTRQYTLPSGTWYTMRGETYSGTISLANREALVVVKELP